MMSEILLYLVKHVVPVQPLSAKHGSINATINEATISAILFSVALVIPMIPASVKSGLVYRSNQFY